MGDLILRLYKLFQGNDILLAAALVLTHIGFIAVVMELVEVLMLVLEN